MTRPDPELVHAAKLELARRQLLFFVKYTWSDYHVGKAHRFLAAKLDEFASKVRARESPRLMVFMPPRIGKSELLSRRYPGWLLGNNPDWSVGIVSYGADLAEELSADARRVVMSDAYKEIFGSTYQTEEGQSIELDKQSRAVGYWRVAGHRGNVRAVGIGGAITGRGFDVLIIDDPVKGRQEADSEIERDKLYHFWQGTLRTRMEPGGGVVLVQTRWHHDDLPGRLIDARGDRWEVINLPAIAEENDPLGRAEGEPLDPLRFTEADYDDLRQDSSEREWAAQYQGRPSPDKGECFEREWFRVEPMPPGGTALPVLQYWDTAHGKRNPKRKGDRSVCATWRVEPNCYRLIHLYVGRPGYHELKPLSIQLAHAFNVRRVLIEDHSSGISLIQDLKNETRLPVFPWKTGAESKFERAKAVAPVVQSGRVVLSIPQAQAEQFIQEHTIFPHGRYDDIVDTTSMALADLTIWHTSNKLTRPIMRDFAVTPGG